MKRGVIDWDFRLCNGTEYEIIAQMQADAKLFSTIYQQKFKKEINKKTDMKNEDVLENAPKSFKIPESHLKLIGVATHKIAKIVQRDIIHDGIRIITDYVTECEFIRDENTKVWDIKVTIRGNYMR